MKGNKKSIAINKTTVGKYIFLLAIMAYPVFQFIVFYVYANINNILLAFKGMKVDGSTFWIGLENFKTIIVGAEAELIGISLRNNLIAFFVTWFIGMPMNILYGYYIYKKRFASTTMRVLFMLPSMISGVVMAMLFMKLVEVGIPSLFVNSFGWEKFPNLLRNNNTAFGVQIFYMLWLGFSSSVIIYSNAMNAIDISIIEAGEIDGTTTWLELRYIIIPLIYPTLSTYIITGFAGLFTASGSLFVFYGLNGVPKQTYFMGYYLFEIAMVGDLTAYPVASATSLLLTVITAPIALTVRWIMNKIDPMRNVNESIS